DSSVELRKIACLITIGKRSCVHRPVLPPRPKKNRCTLQSQERRERIHLLRVVSAHANYTECNDMAHRLLLLIAIYCALSSRGIAASGNAEQFAPVREKIRDLISYWKTPSVTVAVAHKDRIVWEEGFGFADLERKVPANEHTIYSLASISKPITA